MSETEISSKGDRSQMRAQRARSTPARLWNQKAFVERLDRRLEQLGEPPEIPLLREAGGLGDEFRKTRDAKRGLTINSLMIIAKAVGWTIGQAMGTQDPTLDFRREREVDPQKLNWAMGLADEAMENASGSGRAEDYANSVSLAYAVLSEEESSGRSPDPNSNPTLRSAIMTLLRQR